jgi:predicted nuclease of predicted toxin-antitoxin system
MKLKFLIDNALSPIFSKQLQAHGFDVIHVRDVNMGKCSDNEIFDFAQKENRIVVSADTDFGTIVTLRNEKSPSIIIFRRTKNRKPLEQAELFMSNLDEIETYLELGSIVIIEDKRIRIRSLPILQ